MTGLHYPDNLYADALSRKTTPTGSYDARKLREETIAIAQSQDRDNDCLASILAEMRANRRQQDEIYARLVKLAERKPLADRHDLRQGEHPARIGDVPHRQPPNCDGHPLLHVAIRDHDERLMGGESHL